MQKREAAKKLFFQGVKQTEIAKLLRVSEQTVSTWAKKDNWDEQRNEHELFKESSTEKVQRLISYQLKVLDVIANKMEGKMDESMDVQELQKLLISKGDIDALQKLFVTIKGKELEWTNIVSIVRDMVEYIQEQDTALAKKIAPLADEYINHKRQEA